MAQYEDREHYIPVRKADLVDLLAQDPMLEDHQRRAFREFCRLIEATFHFEYHETFDQLKCGYAPFDPDSETPPLQPLSEPDRLIAVKKLLEQFEWLLERANFTKLTKKELFEATEAASHWGLNLDIDFEAFEHLEVFIRGDTTGKRGLRTWWTLYLLREMEVQVYKRVVIILQLREHERIKGEKVDTKCVYLKIFKDIPKEDLEMLLPGGRVKMTRLDQGQIFLPLITGTGMAIYKLASIALAALGNLLTLAVLTFSFLGYGVKSFLGYMRTKQKYQFNLTQSLYYQNLDNNAGVLSRLLDEAEEQECREAILGYFFLWRHANDSGWTEEHLDSKIEEYLEAKTGHKVDFEVHDALEKLERLKIIEETPQGTLKAVPLEKAMEILDEAWDNFFEYHDPTSPPSERQGAEQSESDSEPTKPANSQQPASETV